MSERWTHAERSWANGKMGKKVSGQRWKVAKAKMRSYIEKLILQLNPSNSNSLCRLFASSLSANASLLQYGPSMSSYLIWKIRTMHLPEINHKGKRSVILENCHVVNLLWIYWMGGCKYISQPVVMLEILYLHTSSKF